MWLVAAELDSTNHCQPHRKSECFVLPAFSSEVGVVVVVTGFFFHVLVIFLCTIRIVSSLW